jgi:DNA excision repair protein ERCC-6-like
MKVDVLSDMPPKQEFVVWTHLSTDQRRLYEDYVTNGDTVNAVLSSETKSPLVAVDWLRKLIGHPLLVDDRYDRERSTLHRLSVSTLLQQSAKLEVLVGLIEKLSTSGHRTLIFSNTTMILDIIQRVLHGLNVSTVR